MRSRIVEYECFVTLVTTVVTTVVDIFRQRRLENLIVEPPVSRNDAHCLIFKADK